MFRLRNFCVCDFSRLAVTDWRWWRWRLCVLALMTATQVSSIFRRRALCLASLKCCSFWKRKVERMRLKMPSTKRRVTGRTSIQQDDKVDGPERPRGDKLSK